MHLLKNNFAIALALTIWFAGTSALADYMPPRQVESYVVMSSDWSIDEKGDNYSVTVNQNGKKITWPLNTFLLAHYTNSDSICCGSYQKEMSKFIQEIKKTQPRPGLFITISTGTKGGALEVACVRPYVESKAWEQAIQQGSTLLNLSAEKVRKMGRDKYKQALIAMSDTNWQKMANRTR